MQELPRFQELIFEDFAKFILVENTYEEVVLQTVMKDILQGGCQLQGGAVTVGWGGHLSERPHLLSVGSRAWQQPGGSREKRGVCPGVGVTLQRKCKALSFSFSPLSGFLGSVQ